MRVCVICGKYFGIKNQKPYLFKKQKCCSRQCNAKLSVSYCIGKKAHNNRQVEKICRYCGKSKMVAPAYVKRPYCNRKCMAEYYSKHYRGKRAGHWQGGQIERICLNCGKIFFVDRNVPNRSDRLTNGIFCSTSCKAKYQYQGKSNPNWKGGDVEKICQTCGKKYFTKPCLIDKSKYCSYHCLGVANVLKMPKSNTDIENIMEEWLIENKVEFTKQKPLLGMTLADFHIEPNIIIYCDGDYWHSLNKVKTRDARITASLRENGYNVIRLSGSEIKKGKRPHEILNKI